MTLSPRLRKLMLTVHITASVGWLGSAVGFLALSVAAAANPDAQLVRAAYLLMDLTARYVLMPLSLASLLSGIIQSIGTPWGLFRHYWVIAKLVINLLASVVLLLYADTLGALADIAAQPSPSAASFAALRSPSPALHAVAAVALLLVAVVLSVYKPRGLTAYGWRKQQERMTRRVNAA